MHWLQMLEAVNTKLNEVTVYQTYKENGEEGKQRVYVYANGEKINEHLVDNLQDAIRIKENYESSLNTTFNFSYNIISY